MAYNRYEGNSGRVTRMQDGSRPTSFGIAPMGAGSRPERKEQSKAWSGQKNRQPPMPASGRPGGISGLLHKLSFADLETEDLLLLLILYLLYRESGDEELLIMMGAMFLL